MYPETLEDINRKIGLRTDYGVREEIALHPGFILIWSNAQKKWFSSRKVMENEKVQLDANEIIAYVPKLVDVQEKLEFLEDLPLYKFSFEARFPQK